MLKEELVKKIKLEKRKKGSELVLETLVNLGVETIFGCMMLFIILMVFVIF